VPPSRAITRLRIVRPDDAPDEITPEQLERLTVAVAKLRVFLDSPIALMERATALLERGRPNLFCDLRTSLCAKQRRLEVEPDSKGRSIPVATNKYADALGLPA
jgi:hypothetical protein